MAAEKQILVIDDEENMRHMLAAMLERTGYRVASASDGAEGLTKVKQRTFDFILCDIKMPNMDGMQFLKTAGDLLAASTVIMMSAYGNIDTAVEAMKLGAYDYISKPFKPDEVYLTLKKAEERETLKNENTRLKDRLRAMESKHHFGQMIGRSKPIVAVFNLAEKVSQHFSTVLITGESGTGKELIAREIHNRGDRADRPFVPVNCGGIPENLLESEFFGHKKGAFTGADRDKKGLFEEAHQGTIFLDEIGELPIALQVKLLRVLQENEIRRVGASITKTVDVRVIAATSKHLENEIAGGAFREDLFYRLNVLRIKMPPLRDWKDDIPLLCQYFIERYNQTLNKQIQGISPAAMRVLLNHHWPGNVRELENAIERASVLADEETLQPEHFPMEAETPPSASKADVAFEGYSLKAAQRAWEKELITKALSQTGGNRTKAARLLEISHPSLLSKMKTYQIDL
jgi:two-component system response regulator AtoC